MSFRPALRPGAPLLRRDAGHLQVGTSPGITLTDRPGLFALLRLLDGTRDVEGLTAFASDNLPELSQPLAELMTELRSLGVVADASRWSAPGRRGLDAEARQVDIAGGDPGRLAGRATFRLAFHGDARVTDLVEAARATLADAGMVQLDSPDPELLVIVSLGEPSRSVFELPTRLGLDHLPVVLDEDRVRIGPFVRPGHTPCVTCHDLHRADWDQAWPAILPQLGRHTVAITPPAIGSLTLHAAALEVAAEVLAHADQLSLRTVGRCLVVGPLHDERTTWPVAFHHGCTCDMLRAA
jgi:hypothetical protein